MHGGIANYECANEWLPFVAIPRILFQPCRMQLGAILEPAGWQMGEKVKLRAADGFEFGAYVARPEGEPLGGLVVIQEIFGVNEHIRHVTDRFAKDGFFAVAPALFDRI